MADAAWSDAEKLIQDDAVPNPVQLFWGETLRLGAPFLKVELLRDNPLGANLRTIFQHLKSARWFDTSLILGHIARVAGAERFGLLAAAMGETQTSLAISSKSERLPV